MPAILREASPQLRDAVRRLSPKATSWRAVSRRDRERWLLGQYRAQDRSEGTARFVTDLLRRAFTSSTRSKIGFPDLAPAMRPAEASSGPEQAQWRGVPRPQRRGGEKPRQRQRRGRRQLPCMCRAAAGGRYYASSPSDLARIDGLGKMELAS
jgi:hypothetical protein